MGCGYLLLFLAALFYVWRTNQPVDVEIKLNEASVHNEQLLPLKDAIATMTLVRDEDGYDTFHQGHFCYPKK